MSKLSWTVSLQIDDGPKFNLSENNSPLEAYERIDLEAPTDHWATVAVEPGDLSDIQVILITRTDKPDKPNNPLPKVAYKMNDDATEVEIGKSHLVLGDGSCQVLKAAPQSLKFRTYGDKPGTVTILIGRKASVPPPPAAPPAVPPK